MLVLAVAHTWLNLAGMWAEGRSTARTYMASSTHRQAPALWKTELLVFQKQAEMSLRVLPGYLSPLLYSGADCEQGVA
jgi:hypothetical protein